MKKIIITGPTCAIGHALIDECIKNNVEIYAITHPNSNRIDNIIKHDLVHIIKVDIDNFVKAKENIITDCDVFYHFAWEGTTMRNDMKIQVRNIKNTLDALDLAHLCGCKIFVGAGSQAEYGRVEGLINNSTPVNPENGYGVAKLCACQMSKIKAEIYGIKHIWARIASVYGPYENDNTMITSAITAFLNGREAKFTKAEQIWDYLYVKDAGKIFFLLGSKEELEGKIYLVGRGKSYPLKYYIEVIKDNIDPKIMLKFGEIPYANKQVMSLSIDNHDIVTNLGYEYKYDFNVGIKETIDWIKSREKK